VSAPARSDDAPGPWHRLKDGGRPLAALLLAGVLLKLLVMAAALEGDPLLQHPTSDARYYVERARGLAGLSDDPLADQVFHLPPLYPRLLAAVPGVVEGRLAALLVLQHLFGLGVVLAAYLLAHRRGGRMAGWVAAGVTLLYGPLTFFETRLLGDSLATALLIGAVLACDGWRERPGPWRGALVGALAGLACLLRPQALLFAGLLAVWSWRRGRAAAAGLVVAVALCLAPATLHNLRAGGDLVLVSDNGGINLWLAATGTPSGTFAMSDPAFGEIAHQADVARERAEAAVGHALSPGEVSRHWTGEALAAMAAAPGDQLHRLALRAAALLETRETGVVAFPELGTHVAPPLWAASLPFGVVLAAFAAALVLLLRRADDAEDPDPSAPLAPSLALAAMVVVTTLLFFHYSRFRLPVIPLMAVVVGVGLTRVPRWISHGKGRLGLAALVGLAAGGVSLLPASHHGSSAANAWTSLADARRALTAPGDHTALRQTREELDRAFAEDPHFGRAQLLAAELDLKMGNWNGCAHWLGKLEPVLPDDPRVLAARGLLSLLGGSSNPHRDVERGRTARNALARAAQADPSLLPLIRNLDRLLAAAGG
jgi:4-amino-4-deoxy-L-arabinose transferase-like glycosyltransferase